LKEEIRQEYLVYVVYITWFSE